MSLSLKAYQCKRFSRALSRAASSVMNLSLFTDEKQQRRCYEVKISSDEQLCNFVHSVI